MVYRYSGRASKEVRTLLRCYTALPMQIGRTNKPKEEAEEETSFSVNTSQTT